MIKENMPLDFLKFLKSIPSPVSPRGFIDLCLLAVRIIDAGQADEAGRNEMAYTLSGIGIAQSDESLKAIAQTFLEFEVPGDFDLGTETNRHDWEELRQSIFEADKYHKTSKRSKAAE